MSSRTIEKIVQLIGDSDSQRYQSAVEDAHYTLNKQIECAENRKAELIQAIYFNIILFGSFVALFSLVSSLSLRVTDLLGFIILSGILWLVSTGMAIRGLQESGLRVRFSIEGLDHIVNENYSHIERSKIRLGLFKEIIKRNKQIGSRCGKYATFSIILTIYSTFVIGVGLIHVLITKIPEWSFLLIGVLLVALAYPPREDIQRLLGWGEDEFDVRVEELLE